MSNLGDSFITIIVIGSCVVIMFVFPFMSIAEENSNITRQAVQNALVEFIDKAITTGGVTAEEKDKFLQTLASTGNAYEVELQIQILDENADIKTTQADSEKIGENYYYIIYGVQIDELLDENGKIKLKEGDRLIGSVYITSTDINKSIKNFIYRLSGKETHDKVAEYGRMATTNGI